LAPTIKKVTLSFLGDISQKVVSKLEVGKEYIIKDIK
jgi:hypothetical protein